MAKRNGASSIPTPAIIHWKDGHYSTLLEEKNGMYAFADKGLPFEGWLGRSALLKLTSGYFLIPQKTLSSGWTSVSAQEGSRIFGRDGLHGLEPTSGSTSGNNGPV